MLREIAEVDKKIGLLGKQQFAVEKIALSPIVTHHSRLYLLLSQRFFKGLILDGKMRLGLFFCSSNINHFCMCKLGDRPFKIVGSKHKTV